jgi:hypothetical protein
MSTSIHLSNMSRSMAHLSLNPLLPLSSSTSASSSPSITPLTGSPTITSVMPSTSLLPQLSLGPIPATPGFPSISSTSHRPTQTTKDLSNTNSMTGHATGNTTTSVLIAATAAAGNIGHVPGDHIGPLTSVSFHSFIHSPMAYYLYLSCRWLVCLVVGDWFINQTV